MLAGILTGWLSGCKEAQLSGPVEGADVYIDLLAQPGASAQAMKTSTKNDLFQLLGAEKGSEVWQGWPEAARFLWVGNFDVDPALVTPEALFLVTVSNGDDVDADRDGRFDQSPTRVQGSWRAIMSGEALLTNGCLVSALTEAAYLFVADEIGLVPEADLMERLDDFATLVVTDVNMDGVVDYSDVLRWTRLYSEDQYLYDIALVDNLADIISRNDQDFIRYAAAASVWEGETVPPILPPDPEETSIGGNIDGDLFLSRDMSPYRMGSGLVINGDLTIDSGVTIKGNNRMITVFGNLVIEGVPRQPNEIEDLSIVVNNGRGEAEGIIRNVNFLGGNLRLTARQFTIENNNVANWELDIRSGADVIDNRIVVSQNTLDQARVVFTNNSPARPDMQVQFVNNLFLPQDEPGSQLRTAWEGPIENLIVQDNSFHYNMRVTRTSSNPVLDLRFNYWRPDSAGNIDFSQIIPENGRDSPYQIIQTFPSLSAPDPDTPLSPR